MNKIIIKQTLLICMIVTASIVCVLPSSTNTAIAKKNDDSNDKNANAVKRPQGDPCSGPVANCTPVPEGTKIGVAGASDQQSAPSDSTAHNRVRHHHSGGSGGKALKMTAFAEVFDIAKNSPVIVVKNVTVKSVDSSKTAHFRGQIMNVGQNAVNVKAIVATFYDMTGNIGASSSYPVSPSHLIPGQSVPFDVSFSDDKRTPYNPFKDTSTVKYQIDWTEERRTITVTN